MSSKLLTRIAVISILISLIFATIFIVQAFGVNKRNNELINEEKDTITVYKNILQPAIHISHYVPTHDTIIKTIKIPVEYQAIGTEQELKEKLSLLSSKYFALKNYKDSIRLNDSLGTNIGIVHINDEISENAILDRKVDYQLSVREKIVTINNTTTITKIQPVTRKVFIGVDGNSINQFGASLLYEDRKGNLIRIGSGLEFSNSKQYFSVGIYKKIHL